MTTHTQDPRITELLDWQLTTGRPLPMSITDILAHEDAGQVVDLVTGEVSRLDGPGVVLDLTTDHACVMCGSMPHTGLWVSCWGCHLPVCDRCARQVHDGHFCAGCGAGGGAS